MRILICGSRMWTDVEPIRAYLKTLPANATIITGASAGADRIAAQVARELGLNVEEYPADWKRFGRAAGPIRNTQMLDEGEPIKVRAFTRTPITPGTANMIAQARRKGLEVELTYA